MSDRETTGKRAFPDPDIDPVEAARMLTEMDQALETFKHLVQGYAEIGPPNSKMVCESFLKHADEDRVGLIAFPADNLPEGVVISHEIFGNKHKFMYKETGGKKWRRKKLIILGVRSFFKLLCRSVITN